VDSPIRFVCVGHRNIHRIGYLFADVLPICQVRVERWKYPHVPLSPEVTAPTRRQALLSGTLITTLNPGCKTGTGRGTSDFRRSKYVVGGMRRTRAHPGRRIPVLNSLSRYDPWRIGHMLRYVTRASAPHVYYYVLDTFSVSLS